MCSLCDKPKGCRSVRKMPDGWSRPGHWDENKGAAFVPVCPPRREGGSETISAPSCQRCVCVKCTHMARTLNLFVVLCILGDIWRVPDSSGSRGLRCYRCPLCWLSHTARAAQLMKWPSAAQSPFIVVTSKLP